MTSWNELAIKACEIASTINGEAEALADAVELRALDAAMGDYNATLLMSDLIEWSPPPAYAEGDDRIERAVEAAFEILANRAKTYSPYGYPFQYSVQAGTLQYVGGESPFPYLFLLGLSYTNPTLNITGKTGDAIFEELAFIGLRRLVGSPSSKLAKAVGGEFHLSALTGAFADKVNHIAKEIKEGRKHKPPPSKMTPYSGDRGVDLLIRRGFPDERGSQMIVFAACAAGEDWWGKRRECDYETWTSLHFEEALLSIRGMAKCFIVPRVVPRDRWNEMAKASGMLIDRCRLAMLLNSDGDAALNQCETWLTAAGLSIPGIEKTETS